VYLVSGVQYKSEAIEKKPVIEIAIREVEH
jgi:hypothetical protein